MSRLSILLPALVFIIGGEIPLSATPPAVAVVSPVAGFSRNSLASITGTAADADGVSAVELAVKRQSDGYYWDGAGFVAAQTWVSAVWTDPTWTYATPPTLAEGETYGVYARAQDTLAEWSTTYSTSVFHALPGCGSLVTVKNGAGADFNFIQAAVDSLSKNLTGDACVVVTNDGSYTEEVVVRNFVNNGYRVKIMSEPGTTVTVSPPPASTAGFLLENDSVTVAGMEIIPGGVMPYGILSSSESVVIASVTVVSAGSIGTAGISLSSSSEVSDTQVVVEDAYGILSAWAANNAILRSTIGSVSSSKAALLLNHSAGNLVADSAFNNPDGYGVQIIGNSDNNRVLRSTITSDSPYMAFNSDNSDSNTLTESYVANPSGYGAFLGFGADANNISSSTLLSNASAYFAVKLVSGSNNSLARNLIINTAGVAYTDVSGTGNSLAYSTVTGGGLVMGAAFVDSAANPVVSYSRVSGGAGVFVRDSTGAVVSDNVVSATDTAYAGLRFDSSRDISAFGNSINSVGKGILVNAGCGGAVAIASNTVSGANYGLELAALAGGATINVSSLTFRSMNAASAGVNFAGGQFVSTLTAVHFDEGNIAVNVDASLLAAGSRVTMVNYSGVSTGTQHENDPAGYVDWVGEDLSGPTLAILHPSTGSVLNALTGLDGTAVDNVAVSSAEVSIQNIASGQYWDGSAWGAGHAWNALSLWPSSWTYTNVPAWVDNSSYVVTARAWDAAGNGGSSGSSFLYDVTAPVVAITTPVTSNYAVLPVITGTAADPHGVAQVELSIVRHSDWQYWNGSAWAAGPLWKLATGTVTWNYSGITTGDLSSGTTYTFNVRAHDAAGNISNPNAVVSTVTFIVPPGDGISPTLAVLQPAGGAMLKTLAGLSGTAADNVAVSSAEVSMLRLTNGQYWNGSAWGAGQAWSALSLWPSSWTYISVPAWVDNSTYVFTARAWDAAGNSALAVSSFTYDVTAPVAAITTPTTGTYASFSPLTGTAFDQHGVALVQVSVLRESDGQYWNGAAWAAGPLWNNSTGTAAWSYGGITNANLLSGTTYMFNVRAQDYAGNVSNPAPVVSTFTYVVPPGDLTPPTVAVLQPSTFSYLRSLSGLAGTAADNVAVSSVSVSIERPATGLYWNGASWGAGRAWVDASIWPSSWTYSSVPAWTDASSYTVVARAVDAAGNWSPVYSTASFMYDVTPPQAFIVQPANGGVYLPSDLTGVNPIRGTAFDPALPWGLDQLSKVQMNLSYLSGGVTYYWNGVSAFSNAISSGSAWTDVADTDTWRYPFDGANWVLGKDYTLLVRTFDKAAPLDANGGNESVWAVSTFTVVASTIVGGLGPAAFTGVTASSLTVNWGSTFGAGTTYYVHLSSWAAETPFISSGPTLGLSLGFTGLTPDTSYYGFVSTDTANFTASGSGVTLAQPPSAVDFPLMGFSSVTLAWNTGANPADTAFDYYLSTASNFTALTSSGSVVGSSVVLNGLAEWTQYYGRVRAVNRLGVATAYVEGGSYALTQFHSATGAVSGLAGAALGVSSVSWTWSSGTVLYSDHFAYYDGASVFLGTAAFGVSGVYDQAGLTPNSPHSLRVAGRNGLSQGPLTNSTTVYTLAAVPASPAFGSVGYSTAAFSWTANGNPAGTVYEFELSEFSDFSVMFSSSSGTAASALFGGLAQGSTYYARVRAVNGAGARSVFAEAGAPAITLAHVPTGLVGSLAGAALGVSSISWTWTSGTVADADNFTYYSGAGSVLGSTAFAASASYIQTALTPNTARMLRVGGVNGFGAGPLAAAATVYTLAAVPDAPAIADTGVSSAGITLGLGANPAGTTLQLWRSGDNIIFSSVYEGTALAVADAGLAECSDYYYKARARNGAGYYTGFTGVASFTTLASTPSAASGLYAEALDGARIALSWDPSPSLGVTRYLVFYDNATGTIDYATPLTVVSSTSTDWVTPALTAGNSYKFSIRARGACGAEEKNTTLVAAAQAVGVLSGVRASIKTPQSGKSIKGNRVTVIAEITLGLASQVSQVRFQYSPAGAGAWADIVAANINHPNPDTQAPYFVHWDADAMTPGAYDLRAIATDIYGVPDPSAPAITVNIDPVNYDTNESVVSGEQKKEQKICNTVNSTVQAGDDATTLLSKVVIPSGAVTDSTVAITLVSNPAAVPAPPQGADHLNLSVKVNLSNGQSQLSSGKTAAITFTYKDDDGNGIVDGTLASVDRLKVYTVPDAGGSWTALATSVDKAHKTITASTEHFSFFSVFASQAGGLGSVKVYPVPWQPASGGRFDAAAVTFTGLPASARIKIYTINGELVRQLDVVSLDAGIKTWDGTNSVGHKAASGVYLAFVKSGNDERVIKVAVER
ncbi:MAG: right-handed parallel beta-helix repeat-containing protein [Elusimicrobia bacterium]|nr:right-handed parallel beta-helix repeat-containing protein [Elusimicrobiota bacterium]